MNEVFNFQDGILNHLARGRKEVMTDKQFIEREITRFKASRRRMEMFTGKRYYDGKHDILSKKRTVIGEGGDLVEVINLPNNRIVDNQYKKMVNQKANYLLGKPITFQCKNTAYLDALNTLFNRRFMRLMKNVGKCALNEGIVWVFPTYDENGEFVFKKFNGVSPWEYITIKRVERAIELLRTTDLTKLEIADQCGFTSSSNFYKAFFHVTGKKPGDFVK